MRGIIHRRCVKLGIRAFDVYLNQKDHPKQLVQVGYNEIACFYDTYWTKFMSYLSMDMLKRLNPLKGGKCLDLTCGTGFVTNTVYEMTSGNVTGVDVAEEMIAIARQKYGDTCQFIHHDAYDFLKHQPPNSYDCITCAWGLGYLSPQILHEMSRVLHHRGKIGIIDNSMLSNWVFILSFFVALSEEPSALISYIRPQFFLTAGTLAYRLRMNRFKIIDSWNGEKIIKFNTKDASIQQLIKSGVTAGILQSIKKDKKDEIIRRTNELLKKHYLSKEYIHVTHRYIGVVGEKKDSFIQKE